MICIAEAMSSRSSSQGIVSVVAKNHLRLEEERHSARKKHKLDIQYIFLKAKKKHCNEKLPKPRHRSASDTQNARVSHTTSRDAFIYPPH